MAIVGLVELHGLRQLGVPLVSLQIELVLSFGQQTVDAVLTSIEEIFAHTYLADGEVGEEVLHLYGIEHLGLARSQHDGLTGYMPIGRCGHHDLLVGEEHVDMHTHVQQLLLVGIVNQLDDEELTRVVQVVACLRRQHGSSRVDIDDNLLRLQ